MLIFMSTHSCRSLICVRGRKLSDTLLHTLYQDYPLIDSEFYDFTEAYYQLEKVGNMYKIIKGIRVL